MSALPAKLASVTTVPKIRVLDLFAGAGGLTAGFHAASTRYETVRAVEMDLAAAASYEATFGEDIVYAGSIQDWLASEKVPKVDVVVGGPPCQGFSTLGKQDEEDERNTLWRYYAEAIVRARPKYFIVENVAAFANSRQFQDFKEATAPGGLLEEYDFEFDIFNAADFGAFQARKRTVIVGFRKELGFPGFPPVTHEASEYRTVEEAFDGIGLSVDGIDLPMGETPFAGKMFAGPFTARQLHLGRRYRPESLKRFAAIPKGGNRFNLPLELQAECWKKHKTGSGDVMGRLHLKKPSVTIRTEFFKPEKGRYLHPTEDRAITHYEAAVLQGFPADHKFMGSKTAIARQIGNAVPIPLGEAIARQLASVL
ncbi:DNA methyltransferase [Leifsonia sp. Root112D2]|nr:DNA methyltransferase [Leifsonia sp. Root112D2]